MTGHITPCARPENDPEDWFIERDGKQYADDVLVSEEDVQGVLDIRRAQYERSGDGSPPDRAEVRAELEAEKVKAALVRRRHAKDACYTDCYFRGPCLDDAMENAHPYGTRGGYYPEELRRMRELRGARRADLPLLEGSRS